MFTEENGDAVDATCTADGCRKPQSELTRDIFSIKREPPRLKQVVLKLLRVMI